MKRVISSILVLALVLASASMVLAYEKAHIPVTLRIPQMIILELDVTELVFDEADYDYLLGWADLTRVGVVATKRSAMTATIVGNVPYSLLISAPEEYFVGELGGFVHVSQLKWRLTEADAAEGWSPLTLERVPVVGGGPGRIEVPFDFQFVAFWENPAQVYSGEILFTVVPDGL